MQTEHIDFSHHDAGSGERSPTEFFDHSDGFAAVLLRNAGYQQAGALERESNRYRVANAFCSAGYERLLMVSCSSAI